MRPFRVRGLVPGILRSFLNHRLQYRTRCIFHRLIRGLRWVSSDSLRLLQPGIFPSVLLYPISRFLQFLFPNGSGSGCHEVCQRTSFCLVFGSSRDTGLPNPNLVLEPCVSITFWEWNGWSIYRFCPFDHALEIIGAFNVHRPIPDTESALVVWPI